MHRFLESMKTALLRRHGIIFQGESQGDIRTDAAVSTLMESNETVEQYEEGFGHIDSDDAGFLTEFLAAKLSSPYPDI